MKNKTQEGGDNSTNYQAETINHYGLTYGEVKEIVIDTIRQNLQSLSESASSIVINRAVHFIDDYITNNPKLREGKLVDKFERPIVQKILFDSQKQYGLEGDEELRENLYIVLDRLLENDEISYTTRLLEDAVNILPKLSKNHLVYLATIYILQDHPNMNLGSKEDLYLFFNHAASRLPLSINLSELDINHSIYCGCIYTPTVMGGADELAEIIYKRYSRLFIKSDYDNTYPDKLQSIFDRYSFVDNRLKISFVFDGFFSMKVMFREDKLDYSVISEFEEWYRTHYIRPESEVKTLVKENFIQYYELNVYQGNLNKKIVRLTSLGTLIAEIYLAKIGIRFDTAIK